MASILERLDRGEVIIGDGSYVFTLEKRGYVLAGPWTPEAACEHPDAVKQLALEFARAGADITQTFTFYSTDDKLKLINKGCEFSCADINKAACEIGKSVSREKGTILAGGVTQTEVYNVTKNKEDVREELKKALQTLVENDVDLIICEYFRNIEELEWAIELALEYGKPVASTMCMGPKGDAAGISVGECGVRMARAGANLIGVNCLYDPFIIIEVMGLMKEALEAENLKPHLMAQPLGYRTPDGGHFGWIDIPEFPFAVEPRQITRWEAARFARAAYNLGIRYIGGCCGFEPYHIRAMAEELTNERNGKLPEGSSKSDMDLKFYAEKSLEHWRYANKGNKDFWLNMVPSTGRPLSAPFCKQPDPELVLKSALN